MADRLESAGDNIVIAEIQTRYLEYLSGDSVGLPFRSPMSRSDLAQALAGLQFLRRNNKTHINNIVLTEEFLTDNFNLFLPCKLNKREIHFVYKHIRQPNFKESNFITLDSLDVDQARAKRIEIVQMTLLQAIEQNSDKFNRPMGKAVLCKRLAGETESDGIEAMKQFGSHMTLKNVIMTHDFIARHFDEYEYVGTQKRFYNEQTNTYYYPKSLSDGVNTEEFRKIR